MKPDRAHKRLLEVILEEASDRFANDSCDELDLSLILGEDDLKSFVKEYSDWFSDLVVFPGNIVSKSVLALYLMDGVREFLSAEVADRIAKLEHDRDEWKQKALVDKTGLASTLWSDLYAELSGINQQHMREVDDLKARVKELEAALSNNSDYKSGVLNGPGSGTWSVFASQQATRAEKAEAERDTLKAQLADLKATKQS